MQFIVRRSNTVPHAVDVAKTLSFSLSKCAEEWDRRRRTIKRQHALYGHMIIELIDNRKFVNRFRFYF